MKCIVGLTGQTGSGKSTLKTVADKYGFLVINCDDVAHKVTERKATITALVNVFSESILNEDGVIDRKKLAAAAFKDKASTELLNKTVLPFISGEIEDIINTSSKEYILLDAPTLYESGMDKICSKTVAVLAHEDIRKKRIITRDNLSEAAAELRLKAAKSDDFYIERTDKVIYNNGNLEEFLNEFSLYLESIMGGNLNV